MIYLLFLFIVILFPSLLSGKHHAFASVNFFLHLSEGSPLNLTWQVGWTMEFRVAQFVILLSHYLGHLLIEFSPAHLQRCVSAIHDRMSWLFYSNGLKLGNVEDTTVRKFVSIECFASSS